MTSPLVKPVRRSELRLSGMGRRRRRRALVYARRRIALSLVIGGLVVLGVYLIGALLLAPDVEAQPPAAGTLVGAEDLPDFAVVVTADDAGQLARATWLLDGQDVSDRVEVVDTTATLRLPEIEDGVHVLVVSARRPFPWATDSTSVTFTVDAAPPEIVFEPETLAATVAQPYELRGSLDPEAQLLVNGQPVPLTDGRFALSFDAPPTDPLILEAVDRAGNRSEQLLRISILPRLPEQPVRGVHVTALAWSDPALRAEILSLVDDGLINTVQLDLKDETGEVGYETQVPLARKIGAAKDCYGLANAVELLHDRGVRVIGRLVAFRDPILAEWSWANRKRGRVVQTPDGSAHAAYGGFTNFAHPTVRAYNIDLAEEAARLGVDDILYDYVRRPDGPLESMVFPRLEGRLEDVIVAFLTDTQARLQPYSTFLGASVLGIAATRPQDIAQEIPQMAGSLDYVSPMVYPSHWSSGEYDVDDPNRQPYDIVLASLRDFQGEVEGLGARVVPWLQDFSLGVHYGPAEIRAQIEAARDAGIDEWLLWDPAVTYTRDALEP